VNGPEFEAYAVDFDELVRRMRAYFGREPVSLKAEAGGYQAVAAWLGAVAATYPAASLRSEAPLTFQKLRHDLLDILALAQTHIKPESGVELLLGLKLFPGREEAGCEIEPVLAVLRFAARSVL
jgi:hypothetical protein